MNTKRDLPRWLYEYIFNQLGAEEKPDPKEFCKNLHSDDEKNRIYLGTYFPRSFAESYCIHDNLFKYEPYRQSVQGKHRMSILSVGCGTGGDVLGVLCAMAQNLPDVVDVEVVAYDGNNIAIDYLVALTMLEPLKRRFRIEHKCIPLPITCREDLDHYMANMGEGYDLITSFKFVNELMEAKVLKRDGFKVLADILAPKLCATGLLTLLDVTDKHYNQWQAINLNSGLSAFSKENKSFSNLLPIPCHFYDKKCNGLCYTNQRFYGTFNADDKVVYRVIGRTVFVDAIYPNVKAGVAYARNVDGECCPGFNGRIVIDAFDINR